MYPMERSAKEAEAKVEVEVEAPETLAGGRPRRKPPTRETASRE